MTRNRGSQTKVLGVWPPARGCAALRGVAVRYLAIATLVAGCAPSAVDSSDIGGLDVATADAVRIEPGDDIQARIDGNAPGTTYVLGAGVHRLQSITPHPGDTIVGEDGAVLSGARVLEDFEPDGNHWRIGGQEQEGTVAERIAYNGRDICVQRYTEEEAPRCHRPELLFIDDRLVEHVAARDEVGPGTWFFDYDADAIYIGDDPSGKVVETAVTPQAINGEGNEGVTLRNVVVEKYATPVSTATVQTAAGWRIEGGAIRHNNGTGIRLRSGSVMDGTHVHHNGQLGVAGLGDDIEVMGAKVDHNNTVGYNSFFEAGGLKFFRTNGLVVRDSHIHHNQGVGLATDYDNVGVRFIDNRIEHNAGPGIHYEASFDGVIRGNWVAENGFGRTSWLLGAGILISSSSGVTVEENTVVDNFHGIVGIHTERFGGNEGAFGRHEIADVEVVANVIDMPRGQSGVVVGGRIEDPRPFLEGMSFIGNVYRLGDQPRPFRSGGGLTVEEWRELGQDVGGSFRALP